MPRTGEKCDTSGIYNANCNNNHIKQVALSKGDTFPPCNTSGCSGAVNYTLSQATT